MDTLNVVCCAILTVLHRVRVYMKSSPIILSIIIGSILTGCNGDSNTELPPPITPPKEYVYVIDSTSIVASNQIQRDRWEDGFDIDGVNVELIERSNIVVIKNNTPRIIRTPFLVYKNDEGIEKYVNLSVDIPPFAEVFFKNPAIYNEFNVAYYEDLPFFKADVPSFDQFGNGDNIDSMSRPEMFRYEKEVSGYKFWSNDFDLNKHFIKFMHGEVEQYEKDGVDKYCGGDVTASYNIWDRSAFDKVTTSNRIPANDNSSFSIKLASRLLHKPIATYKILGKGPEGLATLGDGWLSVRSRSLVKHGQKEPNMVYLHEKLHNHGFNHDGNMTYGWADQINPYFKNIAKKDFYDYEKYHGGLPVRDEQFTDENGDKILLLRWGTPELENSQEMAIDRFIVGTTLGEKITDLEVGIFHPNGTYIPFENSISYDNGAVILNENEASLAVLDLTEFNSALEAHPALYVKLTKEQAKLRPSVYVNAASSSHSKSAIFGNGVFDITPEVPLILRCENGLPNSNGPSDTFASGSCIKVAEHNDMIFTGAPSIAALDYLGYSKDNKADKSYTDVREQPELGSTFGIFSQLTHFPFEQDFAEKQDIVGQFSNYCHNLAEISFDGKSNWRRATKSELDELASSLGDEYEGMLGKQGWPIVRPYLTQSLDDSRNEYSIARDMHKKGANSSSYSFNEAKFASCVSVADEVPFKLQRSKFVDNGFELIAQDENGDLLDSQSMTWLSLDKNIATVDDKGTVSFHADGVTYVVAKQAEQHAIYKVVATTTLNPEDVKNVAIQGEDTIAAGSSLQLDAIYGNDGTVNPIWESLTPERFTISPTGKVSVIPYQSEDLTGFVSAEFDGKESVKAIHLELNPLLEFQVGDKTIINVPEELLDPIKTGWDMKEFCQDLYGEDVVIATTQEYQDIYDHLFSQLGEASRLLRVKYMTNDSQQSYERNIVEFTMTSMEVYSRTVVTEIGTQHGVMCVK
ncbi:hypothetical protein WB876_003757 [Vibrio vulnificus]